MSYTNFFRLTTNLHVPDASDAYSMVCKSKEGSSSEFNWLLNDIVLQIQTQAGQGYSYMFYEFQQWRSEASYFLTSRTATQAEIMKRWQDIMDIFCNIVETLRQHNYNVNYLANNPSFIVVGWDANNRVGRSLTAVQGPDVFNNDPTSADYNPSYALPSNLPRVQNPKDYYNPNSPSA